MSDEHDSGPSPKKIAANRLNSQKSTGPRSPEGKARAAQNACKHGLTAVLPITSGDGKEDTDALEEMRRGLYATWQPVGWEEEHKVELLTGDYWRLHRADRYEAGITRKFADNASSDWELTCRSNYRIALSEAGLGLPVGAGERLAITPRGLEFEIELLEESAEWVTLDMPPTETQLKLFSGLFFDASLRSFYVSYRALWEDIQKYTEAGKKEAVAVAKEQLLRVIRSKAESLRQKRSELSARAEREHEAHLLAVSLPPFEVLEKLDRHVTTIHRRIDRTTRQLEHLQEIRARRGHVPAATFEHPPDMASMDESKDCANVEVLSPAPARQHRPATGATGTNDEKGEGLTAPGAGHSDCDVLQNEAKNVFIFNSTERPSSRPKEL